MPDTLAMRLVVLEVPLPPTIGKVDYAFTSLYVVDVFSLVFEPVHHHSQVLVGHIGWLRRLRVLCAFSMELALFELAIVSYSHAGPVEETTTIH